MASENKSINKAIVDIANRIAVRKDKASGQILEDNFHEFWNCFWDSLEHDKLSFGDALEQATAKYATGQSWNRNDRWLFYVWTGINPFCSIPLSQIIHVACNMGLVDNETGFDCYMEGWNRCWSELRNGASPKDAITAAIDADSRPNYEAAQMAIRTFIGEYRRLDIAADRI